MSVKIMSQVWEQSTQKGSHRLVLLAIADSANDSRVCWPSVATLARKAALGERYVRRIIQDLIDSGELEAIERPGTSNLYKVTIGMNPSSGVSPSTPPSEPEVIPTPEPETPPPLNHSTPKPSLNRNTEPYMKRKNGKAFNPKDKITNQELPPEAAPNYERNDLRRRMVVAIGKIVRETLTVSNKRLEAEEYADAWHDELGATDEDIPGFKGYWERLPDKRYNGAPYLKSMGSHFKEYFSARAGKHRDFGAGALTVDQVHGRA